MTMMEEKTNKKKRTKSAPAKRHVGSSLPGSARMRNSSQSDNRIASRTDARIPSRSDGRSASKMSMMREDMFEETIDLSDIPETKVVSVRHHFFNVKLLKVVIVILI